MLSSVHTVPTLGESSDQHRSGPKIIRGNLLKQTFSRLGLRHPRAQAYAPTPATGNEEYQCLAYFSTVHLRRPKRTRFVPIIVAKVYPAFMPEFPIKDLFFLSTSAFSTFSCD